MERGRWERLVAGPSLLRRKLAVITENAGKGGAICVEDRRIANGLSTRFIGGLSSWSTTAITNQTPPHSRHSRLGTHSLVERDAVGSAPGRQMAKCYPRRRRWMPPRT